MQRFRQGFTELPRRAPDRSRVRPQPGARPRARRGGGGSSRRSSSGAPGSISTSPRSSTSAQGNEETIGKRAFHSKSGGGDGPRPKLAPGRGARGVSRVSASISPGTARPEGDTHLDSVEDERPLAALRAADLAPFAALSPCLGGGDDQPRPVPGRRPPSRGDLLRGVAPWRC